MRVVFTFFVISGNFGHLKDFSVFGLGGGSWVKGLGQNETRLYDEESAFSVFV